MDATAALVVGLVIGLLVGAVVGAMTTLARRRGAGDGALGAEGVEVLQARHHTALAQLQASEGAARSQLQEQLAAANATMAGLEQHLRQQQQQFAAAFERHRAEAAAQAERDRAEHRILQALAPVRESLQTMQTTVTELEQQRTHQHGELSEQLRSAAASEERLRRAAESVASALSSNSVRGVWGETQLRRVVEAAGLIERVDFDVQAGITSDAGTGRPDMIVQLPGGKAIAVDAKVPFNAYLEASAIPEDADPADAARRKVLLSEHARALRAHVTALAGKAYWGGLAASPEFVIAFIPSESLLSAAMHADPGLMEFAFGKRVALASPVTLWSVLKSVAYTWQQDVLTEDAKRLFDLSRGLYSRIATMAGHIDKLGRSITASVNDYNGFVGSLERQVLPSARKLAALDEAKIIPRLDGLEASTRTLTAGELVAGAEGPPARACTARDIETGPGVNGRRT